MSNKTEQDKVFAAFRRIPGVGKSIAQDFWDLGLRSLDDLKGADADQLYAKLCTLKGCKVDRCMLYVLRCSIYFATEQNHDPALLKWWHWSDT